MTWIQTYTGKQFDFNDPEAPIELEDIQNALGNLCRFVGHTRKFYSVAEHSIYVMTTAIEEGMRRGRSASEVWDIGRWGLLHDASEAYLGDVSRPLKHRDGFEEYRAMEARLLSRIADRFKLSPEMPEEVRWADGSMLRVEADELLAPREHGWPFLPEPPLNPPKISALGPSEAISSFKGLCRIWDIV